MVLVLYFQFFYFLAQRVGPYGGILRRRFGQDDAELFSSIPANHIVHPEDLAKLVCDGSQNQIAGVMTEGVVEALEVIEVDKQNLNWMILPDGALHFSFERFLHKAAIEKPGQRITDGLVTKSFAKTQTGQR